MPEAPNVEISEAAVDALKAMTKEYFVVMPKTDATTGEASEWKKTLEADIERFPVKYCNIMRDDDNPGARRGSFWALVCCLIEGMRNLIQIFSNDRYRRLLRQQSGKSPMKDTETRRNAVRALGEMCHESAIEMSDDQLSRLFEAVIGGLYDYSADSRGDCGSWVGQCNEEFTKNLKAIIRRDVGLGPQEEGEENNINSNNHTTVLPSWKNEYQKN